MEIVIIISSLIVSVLLGGLIVSFLEQSNKQHIIKILLAFSGGFLLSIAFIHFIPEMYAHSEHNTIGIYILLGFLIQLVLEFFSGGIEHGHIHHHHHGKIPWAILISLSVHSFLEGMPLAAPFTGHEVATAHDHGNDQTLLMGIIFHQLPVAIALMTLLLSAKINRSLAWVLLIAFALTTPAGMLAGFLSNSMFAAYDFNLILAVVVGMFLHISTTIIFETSENHKFNFLKLVSILVGFAIAIAIH